MNDQIIPLMASHAHTADVHRVYHEHLAARHCSATRIALNGVNMCAYHRDAARAYDIIGQRLDVEWTRPEPAVKQLECALQLPEKTALQPEYLGTVLNFKTACLTGSNQ